MNLKIRKAQEKVLRVFSKANKSFALCGGTALELYYLKHRFSADLDFFSPKYNLVEVNRLIANFEKCSSGKIKLGAEFIAEGHARVRFYMVPVKGLDRPLKIDFVEDVVFKTPDIKKFKGVPVYSVKHIYFQKLLTLVGTRQGKDDVGGEMVGGRREARDAFDVYMLSQRIQPLHLFLGDVSRQVQRGMVRWYQTFSRQELKLELLDLDIYDSKFDSREMIIYLETEIKKFVKDIL